MADPRGPAHCPCKVVLLSFLLLGVLQAASAAPTTCKTGTGTGATIKAAAAAATLTTDSTASLDSCRITVTLADDVYTVAFSADATNDCGADASSATGLIYESCCETTDCNVFEAYVVYASVKVAKGTALTVANAEDAQEQTDFCTGIAAAATGTGDDLADVYKAGACTIHSTTVGDTNQVIMKFSLVASSEDEATAASTRLTAASIDTALEASEFVGGDSGTGVLTTTDYSGTATPVVECYSGTNTAQTSYYTAPSSLTEDESSDTAVSCRVKKTKSDATPATYATTLEDSSLACPSTASDTDLLYESCCEEDLCNKWKPVTIDGEVTLAKTDIVVATVTDAFKDDFCEAVATAASADDKLDDAACTVGTVTAPATGQVMLTFTVLAPNRAAAGRMVTAMAEADLEDALQALTDTWNTGTTVVADSLTSDVVADPPIACKEGTLEEAADMMTDVDDEDMTESDEIYSSCRIAKVAVEVDGEDTTYTTTYSGVVGEACPSTSEEVGLIYESCCETSSCNVFDPYLVHGTATLTGTDQDADTFTDEDQEAFCEAIAALASEGDLVSSKACTVESVTDTPAATRKLLADTSIDVTFTLKAPYKESAELMEEAILEAADEDDDAAFETELDAVLTGLDLDDGSLESKVITDPPIKCYTGELLDSDDKEEKPEDLEAGEDAEWSSCRLLKTRTELADGTFTYDTVLTGSADLCPEDDADTEAAAERRRRRMLAAGDEDDLLDLCCEEDLCNKLEDVKVKVIASMTLAGTTAAAFGATQKARFCQAVAKAAGNGVTASDCVVTSVTDSARRRSLQAGSVDVEFEVLAEDMAVGNDIGDALDAAVTDGSFDDELAAAGLTGLEASGFSFSVVTDTKGLSVPSSPTTPTTPTTPVGDWDIDDDDNKKKLALGLGIGLGLGIPVLLAVVIAVVVISRRKQQATSPAPPPGQYP